MFEIICKPDFEYGLEGRLLTCTLYCRTQFGDFPTSQWVDFPMTLLEWWADEISNVARSKYANFKLLFEDGPFWIEGVKEDNIVILEFKTTHKEIYDYPKIESSLSELVNAILSMGINLKHYMIDEKRWENVNEINKYCSKLKNIMME